MESNEEVRKRMSSHHLHSGLKELIAMARKEGKWLQSTSFLHPNTIFSPTELEEHNKAGRYVWARMNWVLVDPAMRLKELGMEIDAAMKAYDEFNNRIVREQELEKKRG